MRTRQTLKSRVGLTLVGVGALLAGVLLGGQIIIAFAQEDEVAEGTNEPVALGPSILVATGKASNGASWALSAYDSDRGLCMSFGFGPGSAGACGAKIDVTANFPGTLSMVETPDSKFVFGIVNGDAKSVILSLVNGSTVEARVVASPEALAMQESFFVSEVAAAVSSAAVSGAAGETLGLIPGTA